MNKSNQLYFVALIPPSEFYERVQKLKEEVAEKYDSKAALRSPPHITLHMPFRFREDREDQLHDIFHRFAASQQAFTVTQNGFGCFEPRVIYVNVDLSPQLDELRRALVKQMRHDLKLENADYKDRPFHPHMTIAFRDLKKPAFYEAWKQYQDQYIAHSWTCNSFFLLRHTGKIWLPHTEYGLAPGN